jgi:hypothetical protein
VSTPNLASTVRRFGGVVTRRRYAEAAISASGLLVRGAATDTEIVALVVDAPATVGQRDIGGQTSTRRIHGYTDAEVRAAAPGQPADVVVAEFGEFEIDSVTAWPGGSTNTIAWYEFEAAEVMR